MEEPKRQFISLFNRKTCIICEKSSKKHGFCYQHFDKQKIKQIIDNYIKYLSEHVENMETEIMEIQHLYQSMMNKKMELNEFIRNNSSNNKNLSYIQLLFASEFEKTYGKTDYNDIPKYNKLMSFNVTFSSEKGDELTISDPKYDVSDHNYLYKNNDLRAKWFMNQSENIKILKNEHFLLMEDIKLISNLTNVTGIVNNNDEIMCRIVQSKIYDHIIYISHEHTIKIMDKNLRYDIYLIIKTSNDSLIEIMIENDDISHYYKNDKYDKYKDIYCIKNGISMCRIDCPSRKITENVINKIIEFIDKIFYTNVPAYYFYDKYINSKTNIIIENIQSRLNQ